MAPLSDAHEGAPFIKERAPSCLRGATRQASEDLGTLIALPRERPLRVAPGEPAAASRGASLFDVPKTSLRPPVVAGGDLVEDRSSDFPTRPGARMVLLAVEITVRPRA